MEIAEHWIQQVIRQGHVRVQHIDRKFNLADMMVKALTKSEFRYWLPSLMGPFQELEPSLMGPFQELEIKPTAGEVLAKRKRVNFESV